MKLTVCSNYEKHKRQLNSLDAQVVNQTIGLSKPSHASFDTALTSYLFAVSQFPLLNVKIN